MYPKHCENRTIQRVRILFLFRFPHFCLKLMQSRLLIIGTTFFVSTKIFGLFMFNRSYYDYILEESVKPVCLMGQATPTAIIPERGQDQSPRVVDLRRLRQQMPLYSRTNLIRLWSSFYHIIMQIIGLF